MKVTKRTLLLIAGIVWMIAGFNVSRLGIISYMAIEFKWYLPILTIFIFIAFGAMFYKMTKKHTKRIKNYEEPKRLPHNGLHDGWRNRTPKCTRLSGYIHFLFLHRSWTCTFPCRCNIHLQLYYIQ